MFGPRLNTVFASRWRALWFSATMLITAYCAIPSDEASQDSAGAAGTAAGAAQKAITDSGLSKEEKAQAEAALKELGALAKP